MTLWLLIFLVLLLLGATIYTTRRLKKRQQHLMARIEAMPAEQHYHDINEFRQLAAFVQLHSFLAPDFPLPPMRSWAISPDFALLVVRLIDEHKPARIVEFGSGSSTLVCGYCMRRNEGGEIISIDHDTVFANKTRDDLSRHGLSEWADVRVAALEASAYRDDAGRPIEWYDAEVVSALPADIDLVIVDGPPARHKALARYPALPAIADKLAPGAVLVLDDADRPEEQAVLTRWRREFARARYDHEPTEKGACVVTF